MNINFSKKERVNETLEITKDMELYLKTIRRTNPYLWRQLLAKLNEIDNN